MVKTIINANNVLKVTCTFTPNIVSDMAIEIISNDLLIFLFSSKQNIVWLNKPPIVENVSNSNSFNLKILNKKKIMESLTCLQQIYNFASSHVFFLNY